jgi:hypothetical protein
VIRPDAEQGLPIRYVGLQSGVLGLVLGPVVILLVTLFSFGSGNTGPVSLLFAAFLGSFLGAVLATRSLELVRNYR